ncbi:zinc transporter [Clostridium sp. JS66]|uniref:zinc transporter n=1 Tax=Clostridium sp. JS66 TaxID=3064705 RepID=UPI00298E4B02|nr:zinc transporter [Clostridium sp. JS66]WPC41516.1 zinc transporter [Clostridium sp. JS66]
MDNHKHEHTHEHSHTHAHDHEHCHIHNEVEGYEHAHEGHEHDHHEHNHNHPYEISMDSELDLSKEEKTLKILLDHWVEHNKSHEDGFKDWIEKSKLMGKEKTAEFIQKAVEAMENANEMLIKAKENM